MLERGASFFAPCIAVTAAHTNLSPTQSVDEFQCTRQLRRERDYLDYIATREKRFD
jgi:hypothetical protein